MSMFHGSFEIRDLFLALGPKLINHALATVSTIITNKNSHGNQNTIAGEIVITTTVMLSSLLASFNNVGLEDKPIINIYLNFADFYKWRR